MAKKGKSEKKFSDFDDGFGYIREINLVGLQKFYFNWIVEEWALVSQLSMNLMILHSYFMICC